MLEFALLLPYISIVFIGTLVILGVGIGSGMASLTALEAINIQPRAKTEITRALLIGLALIETAAILALIVTFIIFNKPFECEQIIYAGIAHIGIACAIGISGFKAEHFDL